MFCLKKLKHIINVILMLYLVSQLYLPTIAAQSKSDVQLSKQQFLRKILGREDRKKGIHNANKILTIFYNFGGIGNGEVSPRLESGIYPIGSGHSYIYEFMPMVGAPVADDSGRVIHIFSDGAVTTKYRDESPDGYQWGFEPLPGYANPAQDFLAMSDNPNSWPDSWPDRDANWDGGWNGEYGKYARSDQDSYYRMNDYTNDEFAFYPDPDNPEMRGLGVEVAVRGYQWAHVAAEDIIIMTYRITNKSPTNYPQVMFSMYGDADIGDAGDVSDDDAWFDTDRDIVYQWDHNNRGDWGGPPAYFGYKFLESPGNPLDGIDNDNDGLADESQYDGIDNDGDWDPEVDDIGSDGLGSLDQGYPGPDNDGTEGNGIPDTGEPNFEITDNDESDQIGLTSFNAAPWPSIIAENDEDLWMRTIPGNFSDILQTRDLTFLYGSGYIALPPTHTRKFSIALLFGEDLYDILRNGVVMQNIYDSDYNFAKPPLKPLLTAVPGDHKVTLYWDSIAEHSRDPIYGLDFEGYTIYRSTDPAFLQNWIITDADGNKTFNKPIMQFDYANGLNGPHPVGINGAQFNMGNDTGLRYTFTDTTVENGQTYYYAVCSYDKGYDTTFVEIGVYEDLHLMPIAPAECTKKIVINATGEVESTDDNTVVVTPDGPALGYQPPEVVEINHIEGIGTGQILVSVIDPYIMQDEDVYEIRFAMLEGSKTYNVFRVSDETKLLPADSYYLNGEELNPLFDGLNLIVVDHPKIEIAYDSLRWVSGNSNYNVIIDERKPYRNDPNPADYEIYFFDEIADTSLITGHTTPFKVKNLTTGQFINFRVASPRDTTQWRFGDDIYLFEYVESLDREKYTWILDILPPDTANGIAPVLPANGDIFRIKTFRPFTENDIIRFRMKKGAEDKELAKNSLDKIAVVPNPYVATASWEAQHYYNFGRGEQKLDFIHLPAKCTIKIFTIRGALVATLEHDSGIEDGTESWNLLSKDGMRIAYGVYIFHVEAPEIGEKMGRFVVIQ
ncbi:MAG: hypothetical protein ACT6FF_10090 [Methanosarcinaceae archaeon]